MNYLFAIFNFGIESRSLPLGIAYVATALRNTGRNILGFNDATYENPLKALLEKINKEKTDVLCIGELSVNYSPLRDTINAVRKQFTHIKIIVGGSIISSNPELMAANLDMDFGCVGYGEETICELADCLERNGDFSSINGLVYKDKSGKIILTSRRNEPNNLDNISYAALELFGFKGGYLPVLGSRSCPNNCTFCFQQSNYKYQQRSLDGIFAEIDYWIEKFEITHIGFSDEVFGCNKEYVLEFCRRIKEYNINFTICYRVNLVTEELIRTLADSGCTDIVFGIESLNQTVLDSMNKKITVEQIKNALTLCRKYNTNIIGAVIFGDCAETYEMALESLRWCVENLHYRIILGFVLAFPGTTIYKQAVKSGRINDQHKFLIDGCPIVNISAMNDEEFTKLRRVVELAHMMSGSLRKKPLLEVLFYAVCGFCGANNSFSHKYIVDVAFDEFGFCNKRCKCGYRVRISQHEIAEQYLQKHLLNNFYFEEFNYSDKKTIIWGATPKSKFRLMANRKMYESVVAVVDRNYERFENGLLGFAVQKPDILRGFEFDVLYVGSQFYREGILAEAKEILGFEFDNKEIMETD